MTKVYVGWIEREQTLSFRQEDRFNATYCENFEHLAYALLGLYDIISSSNGSTPNKVFLPSESLELEFDGDITDRLGKEKVAHLERIIRVGNRLVRGSLALREP